MHTNCEPYQVFMKNSQVFAECSQQTSSRMFAVKCFVAKTLQSVCTKPNLHANHELHKVFAFAKCLLTVCGNLASVCGKPILSVGGGQGWGPLHSN